MNEVTKKKKNQRRRRAFVKKLRKALCCVPSEETASENSIEEPDQANDGDESIGVSVSSVRLAETSANNNIRKLLTKVQSESDLQNTGNSQHELQQLRKTLSESDIKKQGGVRPEGWPVTSSVQASYHQGSATKFKSFWAGSQCTTMAMAGLAVSALKPVHRWTNKTLNKILNAGDKNHGRLLASLNRDPKMVKGPEENNRIGLFEVKGSVPIRYRKQHLTMDVCPDTQSSGVVFSCQEGEKIHKDFGTPLLKNALAEAMATPDVTRVVMTAICTHLLGRHTVLSRICL